MDNLFHLPLLKNKRHRELRCHPETPGACTEKYRSDGLSIEEGYHFEIVDTWVLMILSQYQRVHLSPAF